MTVDDVLELLDAIWLPLDPNESVQWRGALNVIDLDVASQAIISLRDSGTSRPTVRIFQAAYRGIVNNQRAEGRPLPRSRPFDPGPTWFSEQREKIRNQE